MWCDERKMWISDRRAWWLAGLIALTLANSFGLAQNSSLPAVPGGQGFGMDTRAAYGGGGTPSILRVTSLNDSGPGSLREALSTEGPRVVIFEVSGTISLDSPLVITSPYLTVAGQTAPTPGITVRNYGVQISTNDVLLQHLRIRPGADTCNNAIEAWGASSFNIVVDHMSTSWGQDEVLVFYNGSRPMNATVWRSIAAEGLHGAMNGRCGGSPDGVFESHGILLYDHTKNVSVSQTLFAHNIERNPYPKGDTVSYFANNLFYDWGEGRSAIFGDPDGSGLLLSTLVGNHFRRGPSTPSDTYIAQARFLASGSQVYRSDNVSDDGGSPISEFSVINGEGVDPTVGTAPVTIPGASPLASGAVYDVVLTSAGARPSDRDAVDIRLINDVKNRTGSYISSQQEVGGWPDLPVNGRTLLLPANPHAASPSGYTNLEVWLHNYSTAVEAPGNATAITPRNLHILQD
jgi:hypothetical protein